MRVGFHCIFCFLPKYAPDDVRCFVYVIGLLCLRHWLASRKSLVTGIDSSPGIPRIYLQLLRGLGAR